MTRLGMVTLVRLLQAWNAWFPMQVTLLPIVILVRLVQESKATVPMLVTPLPIVTLVRLVQLSNELFPMLAELRGFDPSAINLSDVSYRFTREGLFSLTLKVV